MRKRRLTTIQFAILLFILFAVLITILFFGFSNLREARDKVSGKLAVLDLYDLEEKKLEKLVEEYSMVRVKKVQVENAIPSRESLVDFVEQVELIGDILGVRTTVSLKEGIVDEKGVVVETASEGTKNLTTYTGIKNVEVLEIGVDVKGNLEQIVNFVGILEETKFYTKITAIKISKFEDEDGDVSVSASLTLNLFVEPGKGQE